MRCKKLPVAVCYMCYCCVVMCACVCDACLVLVVLEGFRKFRNSIEFRRVGVGGWSPTRILLQANVNSRASEVREASVRC